jgi:hypothetical protein
MFNSQTRRYDVEFCIASFSAEQPTFALLSTLPQIKDFRFRFEDLSDDRFRELEHVLNSIGVNVIQLTKEAAKEPQPTPPPEPEIDDLDVTKLEPELRVGKLLDEVLHRRQVVHDTVKDETIDGEKRDSEVSLNIRDYHLASSALMEEMKTQIIEELTEGMEIEFETDDDE